MRFTTQTMEEIIDTLQTACASKHDITFKVLDPDLFAGAYAGTTVEVEGVSYLYRSLRAWMDLAELLGCRMHLPKRQEYPMVQMHFSPLERGESFHLSTPDDPKEKYGVTSTFFGIRKMEEPAFAYHYLHALDEVDITHRRTILNLGINRADEFEAIRNRVGKEVFAQMHLTGVDHSPSATLYAQGRFPREHCTFHAADINRLDDLGLDRFDLLISIGTLQSPGIDYKPLLMHLVQNYLSNDAALILGFPNSRWIDGEMLYGAKAAHYRFPEMGVVLEDILFAKRYLQQKKFRVRIIGKQYLFLVATKISTAINQTSL